MIFSTKVQGIPCRCKVLAYSPGTAAKLEGPPERCEPAEPPEFEYQLLDRTGHPAPWLQKKVTPADEDRLFEEYQVSQLEERYGYSPYS